MFLFKYLLNHLVHQNDNSSEDNIYLLIFWYLLGIYDLMILFFPSIDKNLSVNSFSLFKAIAYSYLPSFELDLDLRPLFSSELSLCLLIGLQVLLMLFLLLSFASIQGGHPTILCCANGAVFFNNCCAHSFETSLPTLRAGTVEGLRGKKNLANNYLGNELCINSDSNCRLLFHCTALMSFLPVIRLTLMLPSRIRSWNSFLQNYHLIILFFLLLKAIRKSYYRIKFINE